MTAPLRQLRFVGSSREDLRELPKDVRTVFGAALHAAQLGGRHDDAKPLKGFGGAGVLEVVEDYDGDAYRAVYTVRFKEAVLRAARLSRRRATRVRKRRSTRWR